MIVTINTDASYHPEHKVGAFAFWIICNQGKMMQSGDLKLARHAQDAEIKAIANALHALLVSKFTDVKFIIINTDCKFAIEAIRDKKKHRIGKSQDACSQIDKIILKLRAKYDIGPRKNRKKPFIDWRYVPAHTDGVDKRTWVNNWCDSEAKKALWALINKK